LYNRYLTVAIETLIVIAVVDPLSFNMCKHASGNKNMYQTKKSVVAYLFSFTPVSVIELLISW